MLITQECEVTLGGKNIKWYENLGYYIPRYKDNKGRLSVKRGTKIKVRSLDLNNGSHAKVRVKCDYCDNIKTVSFKDYLKNHNDIMGDCCISCRKIKYKHTMNELYGVDNAVQIPNMREKIIQANQEKYGCDWQMQSPEVKEKARKTNLRKYGVEHVLQSPKIAEKMMRTKCKRHKNPTSKPQRKLGIILEQMYGKCLMEVPCGRCSIDCLIIVQGISIDVEYDGKYWHQDEYRDRRRDNFIKKNGYKILRVKGNKKDTLPTVGQIREQVDRLLNGYTYTEIVM